MAEKKGDAQLDATADVNRIARDYAVMRLEYMEASDLVGYIEDDVKDIANEFHDAQRKLLTTCNKAEQRAECGITISFEQKFKKVLCSIRQQAHSESKLIVAESVCAKLPKINIKPFDGRLENWVSFKQLFDSLIHSRNISNVEKLHYLLSSVQNGAYDLIKNYPLTNDSYLDAYHSLSKYYDRKRQIATSYYEKLVFCKPISSKTGTELERVSRTFIENLAVLEKYKLPDRNFMLFHLLWSKLDRLTQEAFQLEFNSDEIPQFNDLQAFIEKHIRALDTSGINFSHSKANQRPKPALIVNDTSTCTYCNSQHNLFSCPGFLDLDVGERFKFVKDRKLCVCCLSSGHQVKACSSRFRCEECNYSHHTLLHFNRPLKTVAQGDPTSQPTVNTLPSVALTSATRVSNVLFSTARVLLRDSNGKWQTVRALLDCASACNFITAPCAKRLGLQVSRSDQTISGIGNSSAHPQGMLSCEFRSLHDSKYTFNLEALVLPTICAEQPSCQIETSNLAHLKQLVLADPNFACPGPIDLLLNADIFASILVSGLRQGSQGQPKALNTVLGWIVMGGCDVTHANNTSIVAKRDCLFASNSTHSLSNLALDSSLKRFWELEGVSAPKVHLSHSEVKCEEYFLKHHKRHDDGRFIVPLPFVDPLDKPTFSNSRSIAFKRFVSLERKLNSNPDFRRAYVAFMEDYLACHHMEEVEAPTSDVGKFYYIPHHGILRPDSISTPLRVVFDASAKDLSGKSLNDTLHTGQKLQTNIFDLLIRFRWHAIVFTGDVKQMYRQLLVPNEDAEYQRILWRPSSDVPVREYRLRTVTYGVSSAPYMALRSIAQLASESCEAYPSGAEVLARDIYVDDLASGADSIDQALLLRQELTDIFSSGGFHLRKWTSNNQSFFQGLSPSDVYSEELINFEDAEDTSLKILGLLWRPRSDCFQFKASASHDSRCTKRIILSHIARMYDPLGFLGPVTFHAKYLMQLLWTSGVAWDDDVSEDIAREWGTFKSQLSCLSSISIPRRILRGTFVEAQLHGFCDASERGYCAVVYCRTLDSQGNIFVQLICSKSKVAPLRTLSIPRLELQAAVLLADLLTSVLVSLESIYNTFNIFAWSDSSVALSWIKSCPSKWKTFVANRVSHIQEKIPPESWCHVRTFDNPADCGSRGTLPGEFLKQELWWNGPSWLSEPKEKWPVLKFPLVSEALHSEQKCVALLATEQEVEFLDLLLKNYSSLSKILRILSYCFRFRNSSSTKLQRDSVSCGIQPDELHRALIFLIKKVQSVAFRQELLYLERGELNSLPKGLRKLSPFIDEAGLLRVGGRLTNADISFGIKHPFLLPRDHRFTLLLIDDYHHKHMHPGAQTLQNLISQSFWILSAKRAIRSVVSGCVKCFRANPRPAQPPLMGNLPSYRVSEVKPFSSVVIDYGGPFDIALGRGRGVKTFKGYICVFVCTSTKAVHIELASELSTDAFLAALKRFIARRGRCIHIVSDQGRNFIGAANQLASLMQTAAGSLTIKFTFSPPGSPHFNGLAEAGIKSVKTHLSRVIGLQRLTYEEFYTVLSQIEAMLNSRPLTPLSTDANDCLALTPAHFLTLEPLTALPEENLTAQNISVLHRWKLIQKMHQDFWSRWRNEYIHTLQQRMKWDKSSPDLKIGTLVLIINEQTNPLHWSMGRIVCLHPGADGVCRVVTVKTSSGEYKRPVVKVCPLPILH